VLNYFTDETALTSGIAVDREGFPYVTGVSANPRPVDTLDDVFVRKFNRAGTEVIYTLFFGGEEFELSGAIAVDAEGAAYVTGSTSSTEFPVTAGAIQTELNWTPEDPDDIPSTSDAFVAKVNPAGNDLVCTAPISGEAPSSIRSRGAGFPSGRAATLMCAARRKARTFPLPKALSSRPGIRTKKTASTVKVLSPA
jgi:hypothetical protein